MIANVLPGLRDLRAPLSAGFIWLLAVWLLAEPALRGDDSDLTTSLDALTDLASPVAVGAALAFVAYLLGSASEAVVAAVVDRARPWRRSIFASRETLSAASMLALDELALEATWDASRRLQTRGIPERDAYDTLTFGKSAHEAAERCDEAQADARAGITRGDDTDEVRRHWRHAVEQHVTVSDVIPARKVDFLDDGWRSGDWYYVLVADRLVTVIGDEIEQIRTRLLVKQPELFSKVDRLRAEAEFRDAIALPLAALATVILFATGPWWLGLAIAALVPPLVMQGRRRAGQSNDALVEAVRIKEVNSPSLDSVRAIGTEPWIRDIWGQPGGARS